MALPRNKSLSGFAKQNRRTMTKEERHLWYDGLRLCPVHFYRQRIVGPYILDFYCASLKLAIELDGSQHYTPQGQQDDAARTKYLNSLGIEVLRFSNGDITYRFEAVMEVIFQRCSAQP